MADGIVCAACSSPVPGVSWNREGVRCLGCGQILRVSVFPAIVQTKAGEAPEALRGETEASCFYHPQSRATIACADCGRFLCALCDLEVEGRHICPLCFETGLSSHKIETVEPRRVLWDAGALALATFPAILFWPAFITAPWSLSMVFRRWNAPGSVIPRTKIRFILAALFALAEIGFLIFVIYMITQVGLRPPAPTRPPREIHVAPPPAPPKPSAGVPSPLSSLVARALACSDGFSRRPTPNNSTQSPTIPRPPFWVAQASACEQSTAEVAQASACDKPHA